MTGYVLPIGNSLSFSAQQTRQAFSSLFAPGPSGLQAVAGVRPGAGLDVTLVSSTITVTPGAAVVQSSASALGGAYLAFIDANFTATLTAAHATLNRIDLVYLRVRDSDMDGGGSWDCTPVYLAGTAASSPVAPSIPGGVSGVVLATISVPHVGAGSATTSYSTRQYASASGGINIGSNTPGAYAGQYRDDGGTAGQLWRYTGSTWKSGINLATAGVIDWGTSGAGAPISMLLAATSSDAIHLRAGSDTIGRLLVSADGTMAWGPGTAGRDTTLARTGVGQMTLTGQLVVTGVGGTQVVRKTLDKALTSTTTLTADTDMTFTVVANAVYALDSFLQFTGAAGGDIKVDWTVPTSATFLWALLGTGTVNFTDNDASVIANNVARGARGNGGTTQSASPRGTLTTVGTAGTLQMRWAQNTSSATPTTLKAGSWLRLVRLA